MIQFIIIIILVIYLYNTETFLFGRKRRRRRRAATAKKNNDKLVYNMLKQKNNIEANKINKKINRINRKINNPNKLFENVINKCNRNPIQKLRLKSNLLKIYIDFISIACILIIILKIFRTPIPFTYKILKLILFNGFLILIGLFYFIYKIFYPLLKTNILISNESLNRIDIKDEDLIKNNNYINDLINKLDYTTLSNSDIIKFVLHGNINNDSSLSFNDYMKYLFCRKEFRIFNFKYPKLYNNLDSDKYDYLKKYKNDVQWKNVLLEHINFIEPESNPFVKFYKSGKYYFLMVFIYNWPSLFDFYVEDNTNKHISDLYSLLYSKIKNNNN